MIELGAAEYRAWVDALRSGEFPPGTGYLRRARIGGDTYCGLGVLCETLAQKGRLRRDPADIYREQIVRYGIGAEDFRAQALPPSIGDATVRFPFRFRNGDTADVIELNDGPVRLTQSQLADLIEYFYL